LIFEEFEGLDLLSKLSQIIKDDIMTEKEKVKRGNNK